MSKVEKLKGFDVNQTTNNLSPSPARGPSNKINFDDDEDVG